MTIAPEEFKRAAREFASGITIVTVVHEDVCHGMTASSFAAVSLEPPLILVSLEESSRTRELIKTTGRFAVNILRLDQVELARTFAQSGEKPFDDIEHTRTDGYAFLDEAIANLGCTTMTVAPGGDHDVFIADVATTRVNGGEPLVYYDRSYRRLSEEAL